MTNFFQVAKKHTSKWISKEIEEKTFGLGLQMKEPV
jgi:hypothetical protein